MTQRVILSTVAVLFAPAADAGEAAQVGADTPLLGTVHPLARGEPASGATTRRFRSVDPGVAGVGSAGTDLGLATSSTPPEARRSASMAQDIARQRVLVLAGEGIPARLEPGAGCHERP